MKHFALKQLVPVFAPDNHTRARVTCPQAPGERLVAEQSHAQEEASRQDPRSRSSNRSPQTGRAPTTTPLERKDAMPSQEGHPDCPAHTCWCSAALPRPPSDGPARTALPSGRWNRPNVVPREEEGVDARNCGFASCYPRTRLSQKTGIVPRGRDRGVQDAYCGGENGASVLGQPGRPWSLLHPSSLPAASEDLSSSARAPLPLSSFPQSLSTRTPRSQHLFYTSPLLPQSLCLRDQIQAPERGLHSSLPTQPPDTQHSFKPGPRSRECCLHALWANAPAAPASLPPAPFAGPAFALLSRCSNPDHRVRRYHPHLKPEHPRANDFGLLIVLLPSVGSVIHLAPHRHVGGR